MKSTIIIIAVALPAILMYIGSQTINWPRLLGRRLPEFWCRVWGLSGIIAGTAAALFAADNLGVTVAPWGVVGLFIISTVSAGATTGLLWLMIDAQELKRYMKISEQMHGDGETRPKRDQLPPKPELNYDR